MEINNSWEVKIKEELRGSTQEAICPLTMILTAALWPLVSILPRGVVKPLYCILCVCVFFLSYYQTYHLKIVVATSAAVVDRTFPHFTSSFISGISVM